MNKGFKPGHGTVDSGILFYFINSMEVGIGILRSPRILAEDVENEGWVSLMLAAVIVQLILYIGYVTIRKYDNLDALQVSEKAIGKWLTKAAAVVFAAYYMLLGSLLIKDFAGILQDYIFPTTKSVYILLLLLYPCYLLLKGGISLISRFAVVVVYSTIYLMIFLYYPFKDFHWEFLFPVFHQPIHSYLKGTLNIMIDFIGFEILFLCYPNIVEKRRAFLFASYGHWFTTFVYMLVIIVSTGRFGAENLKVLVYPLLDIFRMVHLPFIERIEFIALTTWTMQILISAGGFLWAAGHNMHYLNANWKWVNPICLILLSFVVIISLPQRFVDVDTIIKYTGIGGILLIIAYALILFLLTMLKRRETST